MTKLKRTEDGGYIIKGKKYETLRGTRRQVHEYETAYKTAGGLLKGDLVQNDKGRIVSKAKFDDGPNLLKNLTKRGFFTKKGKFGHTKMKTRKLRKKLTRKNRRKMKGGATITELKEQLGEVKEMIPNKIEEIKQNTAYKGVVTLAGEKTFEENLFAPLEELNKTIKKPIDKIEDKIKELESNFDEGKGKLKNEVETQFTELKTEFEKQYNSVIDELIGVIQKLPPVQTAVTTANMTGMSNPLDLFKTFMNQIKDQLLDMIDKKKEEILRQIDELTPDDILNKAVEAVKKSTEETAEKTIEKPAAEKNENAVKDVVEEAEAKLDKQTQEESSPDKAAKITAEKMKAMAETQGGKKKSKGKK
jgi:hypothetical protein|tara:strand:+ start:428 stop:1510 length:1083 start_codon:yes stop_codon:yes gene_type:complete